MADIAKITMTPIFHKILDKEYLKYDNKDVYTVHKIYENNELVGFCIYHDMDGIRFIDDVHYIGNNNYTFLRMVKKILKGTDKFRAIVQKANTKMVNFYFRVGFNIRDIDPYNLLLERC